MSSQEVSHPTSLSERSPQQHTPLQEPRLLTHSETLMVAVGEITKKALSNGIKRGWGAVTVALAEHRDEHFKDTAKLVDSPPVNNIQEVVRQIGVRRARQEVAMANSIPLGRVLRRGLSGFGIGVLEGATGEISKQIGNAATRMVSQKNTRPQ